jgi:hypothetical protein
MRTAAAVLFCERAFAAAVQPGADYGCGDCSIHQPRNCCSRLSSVRVLDAVGWAALLYQASLKHLVNVMNSDLAARAAEWPSPSGLLFRELST